MNNQDLISKELRNNFSVKNLNSLIRIWDPGWKKKIGSGMKKIRIRDKHPGSATRIKSAGSAVPVLIRYLMMVVAMASRVKLAPHVHHNGAGGQHGGVPAPHNGGVSVARQQLQHSACQHLPNKRVLR